MKTFEQYIGETKQNYIFGGTDNRNTNVVDVKTFAELEKGDRIYYWNKGWYRDCIFAYEIESISKERYIYTFNIHNGDLHVYGSAIEGTLDYSGGDVVEATTLDELTKFIHDKFHIDTDSLVIKYR